MLSVAVITHNEEDNIWDALESVKWADEIVVTRLGELSQSENDQEKHTAEGGGKAGANKTQQAIGQASADSENGYVGPGQTHQTHAEGLENQGIEVW